MNFGASEELSSSHERTGYLDKDWIQGAAQQVGKLSRMPGKIAGDAKLEADGARPY
jgi:uncharacterized protein YjbJ (UPF0337 family)